MASVGSPTKRAALTPIAEPQHDPSDPRRSFERSASQGVNKDAIIFAAARARKNIDQGTYSTGPRHLMAGAFAGKPLSATRSAPVLAFGTTTSSSSTTSLHRNPFSQHQSTSSLSFSSNNYNRNNGVVFETAKEISNSVFSSRGSSCSSATRRELQPYCGSQPESPTRSGGVGGDVSMFGSDPSGFCDESTQSRHQSIAAESDGDGFDLDEVFGHGRASHLDNGSFGSFNPVQPSTSNRSLKRSFDDGDDDDNFNGGGGEDEAMDLTDVEDEGTNNDVGGSNDPFSVPLNGPLGGRARGLAKTMSLPSQAFGSSNF